MFQLCLCDFAGVSPRMLGVTSQACRPKRLWELGWRGPLSPLNRMSAGCTFEVWDLIWNVKLQKSEAGRRRAKLQIWRFSFLCGMLNSESGPLFSRHRRDTHAQKNPHKDNNRLILSLESTIWLSLLSVFLPSRVTLCIISKIDGARRRHSGCHAGRVEIEISDVSVSFYIIISLTNSCGLQIECIQAAPP